MNIKLLKDELEKKFIRSEDKITIFISYSSKNKDVATSIYNGLKVDNFEPKMDSTDFNLSEIPRQIIDKIAKADCLVALISHDSLESDWVIWELFLSMDTKRIFYILLDDSYNSLFNEAQKGRLNDKLEAMIVTWHD